MVLGSLKTRQTARSVVRLHEYELKYYKCDRVLIYHMIRMLSYYFYVLVVGIVLHRNANHYHVESTDVLHSRYLGLQPNNSERESRSYTHRTSSRVYRTLSVELSSWSTIRRHDQVPNVANRQKKHSFTLSGRRWVMRTALPKQ